MPTVVMIDGAVERQLLALEPRACDFRVFDVADPVAAWAVLPGLPVERLLLAGTAAGPALLPLLRSALGYDPAVQELLGFLRQRFLPDGAVPPVPARVAPAVRSFALGAPGDPVAPGLFPGRVTKLARLALAAQGGYPAEAVRAAAEHAYDGGRPYHAHDALACALVHPGVDGVALAARHEGSSRGWKSRRKTARVLAWARRESYLPPPVTCECRHERFRPPRERWEAFRLTGAWSRARPLLELVEELAWGQAVHRCVRCGRYWREDVLSSGHADLSYGYPLDAWTPTAP
ncbi:hypothetical protein ACFFX1_09655 [Dactylosporangium sucinum]|uniref:hypothetical protein n=1 Tax=Dactylosporangium sucinum TaxID=1424081 RepID=UPI00167E7E48|nr:hypothetical protein [Dactylosporangium sucinum]